VDQPRRIVLNSIASEGLIQKVGVTDQNAIAVPTNVHYAGWFSQSVKPGDEGLSVIDGHVTGRYNDGIFRRLKDMRPGDVFSVEYGDKSIREFEVVETRTLPEADSIKFLMYKRQDIGRQLNLITCTGKYDDTRETFYDRVVVVSKSL
jgi:LPXTG-site transpeptidase (sortase) family protein